MVGFVSCGAELTPNMNRQKRYGKLALPFESHPISDFVRKALDKTKYKKVIAANIVMVGVVFNTVTSPSHAFDYQSTSITVVGAESQQELNPKTESKYRNPVESPIGVSQSYHAFHPGIDVRAHKGTSVVSIDEGIVIEVKHTNVGYGHYVRVAHAGTVSSLYAHLDKVEVKVGQKLGKGEEIGTIGVTGWSTGPHLHFEIYEGTSVVNPQSIISF